MAERTVIGAGVHVRGTVSGEGDLEIEGIIEGDVDMTGTITVQPGALIKANLKGDRIVLRGAVRGDVVAATSALLEDGARLVGNVHAPSIGIGDGALVRGRVETDASPSSARRTERFDVPATPPARQAPRPAPSPAARSIPPARGSAPIPTKHEAPKTQVGARTATAVPTRVNLPAPVSSSSVPTVTKPQAPHPMDVTPPVAAPKKGPPAPVVPALKKGTRGAIKKKAGSS